MDIDWETLTTGPDGVSLAETIRDFIHERFRHVQLPRLIRSVTVHSFDLGSTAPQVTLKDISDPLPDFYENDSDESETHDDQRTPFGDNESKPIGGHSAAANRHNRLNSKDRDVVDRPLVAASQPGFSLAATPGMLGPNAALNYFQLPLSSRISTTATPLAAVAGAHFQTTAAQNFPHRFDHHHAESFSSISPPPSTTPPSRPTSNGENSSDSRHASAILDDEGTEMGSTQPHHEVEPEDLQVVFHAKYGGDVRLCLTAEVFLDFPMPSFVGIPLKMTVTGMTFDGVGILAYIKRKAHLCFLSPEDAEALVGGESSLDALNDSEGISHADRTENAEPHVSSAASDENRSARLGKVGALLEDIRIETEMGETDDGRQVLKNVGKIEKFVLEQVQRIFEDEFVYPSFWTFLV